MKRLFALVAVAAVAASACGAGQAYAAQVNGVVIPKSAVDGELKDISANKPYVKAFDQQQQQQQGGPGQIEGTSPGTFSSAFVADLLTQRVEYAMIHQEDQRRHILPNSAAVAQAKTEVSQGLTVQSSSGAAPTLLLPGFPTRYQNTLIQRRADLDALRNDLGKPLTDPDLQQFYRTNQDQFVTEMCVRHILVADQATATQLRAQLAAGADFATLAKAHSTDTGSAANGGQLTGSAPDGCLTNQDVSQLVTQFAQAMVSLPVNQISQPVQSQFGFHLIEVTSRTVEPYDPSVAQAARQSLAQQAFLKLLVKLVQQSSVKIDPGFGHFDKSIDTSSGLPKGVVPPKGPQLSTSGQQPGSGGSLTPATTTPGG